MPARPLALGLRGPNRVAIGRVRRMVAALRRIGGNLWMVDTAFSGAFVDNVGTQPVTAYADLLGLTTDRLGVLGPNRVTNGDNETALFAIQGGIVSSDTVARASAPGGGFAASSTSTTGASVAHRMYAISPMLAGKTYQFAGRFYVPTGGIGTFKIYDNADGSWFGISSTAKDQWVPFSFIRTAKSTNWDLGIGDNVANVVTSGQVAYWIDDLTICELTGSHATQSAVASKPSVQRVPKRLGPNRITNGTFDVDTSGWTSAGGVHTWVAGALRRTTGQGDAGSYQDVSGLTPGKSYQFRPKMSNITLVAGVAAYVYVGPGFGALIGSVLGTTQTPLVFTATSSTVRVYLYTNSTSAADFDDIEVCEVLEWTNAISFDGNNDFLTTGITTGNEGFVAAAVTFGGAAGANETVADSGGVAVTTNKGFWLFRWGGAGANWLEMRVGNGTAVTTKEVSTVPLLGVPRVVEGGWDASNVHVGVDGVVGSKARTGDASPSASVLRIGGYQGAANYLNGPMHAIAYAPVLPDAATRKIIINGLAALQGRGPL